MLCHVVVVAVEVAVWGVEVAVRGVGEVQGIVLVLVSWMEEG